MHLLGHTYHDTKPFVTNACTKIKATILSALLSRLRIRMQALGAAEFLREPSTCCAFQDDRRYVPASRPSGELRGRDNLSGSSPKSILATDNFRVHRCDFTVAW